MPTPSQRQRPCRANALVGGLADGASALHSPALTLGAIQPTPSAGAWHAGAVLLQYLFKVFGDLRQMNLRLTKTFHGAGGDGLLLRLVQIAY